MLSCGCQPHRALAAPNMSTPVLIPESPIRDKIRTFNEIHHFGLTLPSGSSAG